MNGIGGRMKRTFCDKCGKEMTNPWLVETGNSLSVVRPTWARVEIMTGNAESEHELCCDCVKDYLDWLYGGSNEKIEM